jgi:hypothetical protein
LPLSLRRSVSACALAFAASAVPVVANARADVVQADAAPQLRAVRIPDAATPPALDGRVTDEIWGTVAPHSAFTQTDPIEGAPASERAEVRVLFDTTMLQVASRWNPFDGARNVGLDVKWGVRPNLTADFTVNTDCAQVEADEEQLNLTRFDLFFPEKRGFFLENASVFQFGVFASW